MTPSATSSMPRSPHIRLIDGVRFPAAERLNGKLSSTGVHGGPRLELMPDQRSALIVVLNRTSACSPTADQARRSATGE